jgi:hypothetical protein
MLFKSLQAGFHWWSPSPLLLAYKSRPWSCFSPSRPFAPLLARAASTLSVVEPFRLSNPSSRDEQSNFVESPRQSSSRGLAVDFADAYNPLLVFHPRHGAAARRACLRVVLLLGTVTLAAVTSHVVVASQHPPKPRHLRVISYARASTTQLTEACPHRYHALLSLCAIRR